MQSYRDNGPKQNGYRILLLLLSILGSGISPLQAGRVVVLGFDGADAQLVKEWMEAGHLPHLARLAKQGCFYPLQTTNPAQSPTAWASFSTGCNPGAHRIFGFLKRREHAYEPELATARVVYRPLLGGFWGRLGLSVLLGSALAVIGYWTGRWAWGWRRRKWLCGMIILGSTGAATMLWMLLAFLPARLPYPENAQAGLPFWTIAGQQGIPTVVLGAPMAFPAEEVPHGRLLCGFGVPDVAGTNGLWSYYSSRFPQLASTETGGWKVPLEQRANEFRGMVLGPKNLLALERYQALAQKLSGAPPSSVVSLRNEMARLQEEAALQADFVVQVDVPQSTATLSLGQQKQTLTPGQWSDWFTVPFSLGPFLRIYGMARFRLIQVTPTLELYLTPVQFHPHHLPAHIDLSYPRDWAGQLAGQSGLFPTLGWAEATNPLKDECIDDRVFWEDLLYSFGCHRRLLQQVLQEKDWQLLVAVFYAPDRAGHMLWRFLDPAHPRHERDCQTHPDLRNSLLQIYQQMDALVGETWSQCPAETTLLVVSDHGFAPFLREVHLNRWLEEQGYLVLKPQAARQRRQILDLFRGEPLLEALDWSQTLAYSMGLGKIYINLAGREPQGIVKKIAYQALCQEIAQKLKTLRDADQPVVQEVYHRQEIYHGPYLEESADLIIGFRRGYRISWQSTLGGVPDRIFEDNLSKWSGDHCSVDPSLVPGILFSNRQAMVANPSIEELAPSILSLLGIAPPTAMEGRNLFPKKP